MPRFFGQTLLKAAQLTRGGHLMDATRLIQKALAGSVANAAPFAQANPASARAANDDAQPTDANVIDVEAKLVVDAPVTDDQQAAGTSTSHPSEHLSEHPTARFTSPVDAKSAVSASRAPGGIFLAGEFVFEGKTYPYRLYGPALSSTPGMPGTAVPVAVAMPLLVLLHGCKQNAQDFAAGTAMNTLADTHGCLVLYPQQITSGNAQMCWNWFEPAHQAAGQGETGMIAALTRHILDQPADHFVQGGVADPTRVYIAGLSAGGAMAAVVAAQHPSLFAALGVHSGLASGAAHDMMSAFKAMGRGAAGSAAAALPTIVFHGTADGTVSPANGDKVAHAAVKALQARGTTLVASHDQQIGDARGSKQARRTVYRDASGTPQVEQWSVAAGPHAWSGGSAAGSYTDPGGPSASAAMLAFFLQHRKA